MNFKKICSILCAIQMIEFGRTQLSDKYAEDCVHVHDEDKPCKANITLDVDIAHTFIVGSRDLLRVAVRVENVGPNHAPEAKFFLTLPIGLNYDSISNVWLGQSIADPITHMMDQNSLTSSSSYTLEFDIGNPMPNGDLIFFTVLLSASLSVYTPGTYHFFMKVNSTASGNVSADNVFEEDVEFRIDTNLTVKHWSIDKPILYKISDIVALENVIDEREIGPRVEFQYQICNEGKTPIQEAVMYFLWPNRTLDGDLLLYHPMRGPATTPDMNCEPATDAIARNIQLGEASTGSTLEKLTTGEMSTLTKVHDAELTNFLSCPHSQCAYIRCIITSLEKVFCAHFALRLRLFAQTMKSMGKNFESSELHSKVAARISKMPSHTFKASEQPLVVDEVKFSVLPFSQLTFLVTSNDTERKWIGLDHKSCTLGDGSRVSCATIDVCFLKNGTTTISLVEAIDVQVSWYVDTKKDDDPRMFFLEEEHRNSHNSIIRLALQSNTEQCFSKQVYIVNHIRDKLSPFHYEVYLKIPDSYDLPVATIHQNVIRDTFHIAKNCGSDDLCVPNLRLNVTTASKYVLGSKDLLELDITIENNGEDAYESVFYMPIPIGVSYRNVDRLGLYNGTIASTGDYIKCYLGNPMISKEVVRFKVFFAPSPEEDMSSIITFAMNVSSTNPEIGDMNDDNFVSVEIPIHCA